MTEALAIFINVPRLERLLMNTSFGGRNLHVVQRSRLATIRMAVDLQYVSWFQSNPLQRYPRRCIAIHLLPRKRIVCAPFLEQIAVEIQVISRHAVPKVEVLHGNIVVPRGAVEDTRRRTRGLALA